MRVLVACESSGTVRDAFTACGHEAWSCDLLDCDKGPESGLHHVGDVLPVIEHGFGAPWDLIIAHPPCTYLSVSGLHWNGRVPGRAEKTEAALDFVFKIMNADCPRIVIENPVSCISRIRKPTQTIQPYQFGHDASKRTCLWLKGVRPLRINPADRYPGRLVMYKGKLVERWSNQTDSGQNKLAPSANRWKLRSQTYTGIARAMAQQWGTL